MTGDGVQSGCYIFPKLCDSASFAIRYSWLATRQPGQEVVASPSPLFPHRPTTGDRRLDTQFSFARLSHGRVEMPQLLSANTPLHLQNNEDNPCNSNNKRKQDQK
jgi:hypothetical protein